MKFEFYVHGLWILSAIFFLIAGMIAGNIEFTLGTTQASYALSLLLAFILFLIATMLLISAAINAIKEER
jgi:arginine exporter protein ArgO